MLHLEGIKNWLKNNNYPELYALQISNRVFKEFKKDYEDWGSIPEHLIKKLEESFEVLPLKLVKNSFTEEAYTFLLEYKDGKQAHVRARVEGGEVCHISLTATQKQRASRKRSAELIHFSPLEIADQLLFCLFHFRPSARNSFRVEIGGSSDPLENYESVKTAISIISCPHQHGIPLHMIQLRTSGYVPGIKKMIEDRVHTRLSVDLHLVQSEKMYKLEEVMSSLRRYAKESRKKLHFNYEIKEGHNDTEEHAREVADQLSNLLCEVSLSSKSPTSSHNDDFKKILELRGIPVTM